MTHSIISQLFLQNLIIQSLQWYRCESVIPLYNEGSLEITLTVPLSHEWVDKTKNFSL